MEPKTARAHLLLVEGIPTSGKSTLIDALIRHHVASSALGEIRTLVSLTQDHTGGPLNPSEDAGSLTREDVLEHLDSDVERLDKALADLGGKLLPLRMSSDTLWEPLFEGRERQAFREGYARRFGRTREDIHHYFMNEQERMERLFEVSTLEKQTIDADPPLEEHLPGVYRWWAGDHLYLWPSDARRDYSRRSSGTRSKCLRLRVTTVS